MLTSDYINSIELSTKEKELLGYTYAGLDFLYELLGDKVYFEDTALSKAIGQIDLLRRTILTLLSDKPKVIDSNKEAEKLLHYEHMVNTIAN